MTAAAVGPGALSRLGASGPGPGPGRRGGRPGGAGGRGLSARRRVTSPSPGSSPDAAGGPADSEVTGGSDRQWTQLVTA